VRSLSKTICRTVQVGSAYAGPYGREKIRVSKLRQKIHSVRQPIKACAKKLPFCKEFVEILTNVSLNIRKVRFHRWYFFRKPIKNCAPYFQENLLRGDGFPCLYCDKSFVNQSSLERHVVVHTREKRFACPQCGRKFTQSGSMFKHMKRHCGAVSTTI